MKTEIQVIISFFLIACLIVLFWYIIWAICELIKEKRKIKNVLKKEINNIRTYEDFIDVVADIVQLLIVCVIGYSNIQKLNKKDYLKLAKEIGRLVQEELINK